MTRRDDPSVQHDSRASDAELVELEQTICQLEAEMADLEWAEAEGEMSEIQELVWALLDDEITEPQLERLEQLLREDPDARETYVQCIQMHVDLVYLLGQKETPSAEAQPTIGLPAEFPALGPDQPLGK